MTISTHSDNASRSFLATLRDDLRQQRQARREYRTLVRDLASYTSRSDIDDLMAIVDRESGPEAETIREILNQNRQAHHRRPLAS